VGDLARTLGFMPLAARLCSALVRVDLHVHSSASFDCKSEPHEVAARARSLGLQPLFLTDHNSIAGAAKLAARDGARVVVGEEIMTAQGELIGLFLERLIPKGLGALETALEIKSQGGLVYLEHPYDPSRRRLAENAIEELADQIDIVEVFNGRSDERSNRLAEELRQTLGVAAGAGSDAHTIAELGSVYVEMEEFDGPADFLAKLRRGRIVTGRSKLRLAAGALLRTRKKGG
jgi:predicted metal-dependent phosphoesterase TrpH